MSPAARHQDSDPGRSSSSYESKLAQWLLGINTAQVVQSGGSEGGPAFSWRESEQSGDSVIAGSLKSEETRFNRTASCIALAPDHLLILLVERGEFISNVYGEERLVHQGDLMIQDASQPCSLRFDPQLGPAIPCEFLYLVLSRSVLGYLEGLERLHGRVVRRGEPLNHLLGGHLKLLLSIADQLSEEERRCAGRGTVGFFVHALELLCGRVRSQPEPANALLSGICTYIEQHLDQPLDVGTLCRRFGISRSSLYRLFEPLGGIATHIRHRRLIRARQYLLSPAHSHLSIAAIARRCGLEANTFTRLFNQTYGVSPREARIMAIKLGGDPLKLAQTIWRDAP